MRRNTGRFPSDFMFQLTKEEHQTLRFQFGILEKGKHSKYMPHVFTEQGVAMLSSVLKSERAIRVNIAIMRAFVKLKQVLATHKEVFP
ncbi:MAG: ORF6N domain-containing protein [Candidatus Margulisiibacteriota bacterium]|nr:ORF6N domain-containing protein [Candidatus Margulisiibacteriota bacterium]